MSRNFAAFCGLLHLSAFGTADSLFNGFFNKGPNERINKIEAIDRKSKDAENQLLTILENTEAVGGRGAKLSGETLGMIENNIKLLENGRSIVNPTSSPALDGCWKLLYTSSPGTNSPIQRTFTSFDGVSVYQIVNAVNTKDSFLPDSLPDVSNTVCFGESTRLRVTALASTVTNGDSVSLYERSTCHSSMLKSFIISNIFLPHRVECSRLLSMVCMITDALYSL